MNPASKIIIFVILMGTVSGALLVGVNVYTAPMIAKNEELKLKSSVLDVLEVAYEKKNCLEAFDKSIKTVEVDKYKFYRAPDNSIALEFYGPGLWSPISGIISLEKDLKTIRRIKITHQEETPGLGGRIAEEDYLNQFRNKEVLPRIIFMPEGKSTRKNEVDAITGATGSSRAFEKLINESIQKYLAVLNG